MDPDRLARMENLTRRYAKHRPSAAGLATMWGSLIFQFFAGLVLGWLAWHWDVRPQGQGFGHFLLAILAPTRFLLIAAVAAPLLIALGLAALQAWVDRAYGAVQSKEAGLVPSWVMTLLALSIPCVFLAFETLRGLWNRAFLPKGWPLAGTLLLMALILVWGQMSRDDQTKGLMVLSTLPSFFVLKPGGVDALTLLFIFGAYLILMALLFVKGAIRFMAFQKVKRELDAFQAALP